ncbi:gamma-glutamyltranspeptidase [Arenimonas soli]|uniref:Glutathione hydrolase proenzyme n=1 Tax=Arenimonas soli TaxID=2269504 RepID=A0ABQ1HBE2_9GAMM|nr:gamma-glutamyltransferase [Arenimonas soli]GGA69237.1 gamma-glutamyltranspeptidase [Arenimonas soli]
MIRFLLPVLLALSPLTLADDPARSPADPAQAGIASANAYATDAGMEVLAKGGNAFDAAIAVSATLGLVEPESSGLGGGAFMLLRVAGEDREVFIDARERAPLAASRDMFLDADGKANRELSVNGALAAGIPGLPAGLDHLAKKYGRLPLSQSLAPAIRLAHEGWRFGPKNAAFLGYRRDVLRRSPAAAKLFLRGGEVPAEGTLMRNKEYARTLEILAAQGADGFYKGDFARRLARGVREAGGIWTEQDLAQYTVVEREPLRIRHRGFDIVTAPPPSSGGVALATMLKVLEGYDYPRLGKAERSHLFIEAMRRAYRDRALYLGDPDFVQAPVDMLVSDAYAAGLRASIHPARATPSDLLPGVDAAPLRPDTSHFSIIDTEGNLVAVTQTVNLPYGSALMVPGTGFLLNNEMDDFSVKPGVPNAFGLVGDDANAIAPGKRPLSSMTPSFLVGPERTAVLGTPGGSRIITMVLLGLVELMQGEGAQATAAAPRFHHQYLPDVVQAEADAFTPEQIAALEAMGHDVQAGERTWGNMQVVLWNHHDGGVETGTDPRWKGVGKGTSTEASVYR